MVFTCVLKKQRRRVMQTQVNAHSCVGLSLIPFASWLCHDARPSATTCRPRGRRGCDLVLASARRMPLSDDGHGSDDGRNAAQRQPRRRGGSNQGLFPARCVRSTHSSQLEAGICRQRDEVSVLRAASKQACVLYQRRAFDFSKDDLKLGEPDPVRPAPPEIYTDSHLFEVAKIKMANAKDDAGCDTPPKQLRRRIERRVIFLSFNYFIKVTFSKRDAGQGFAPEDLSMAPLAWTENQVIAWAMPMLELTAKNAIDYAKTGAIAYQNRTTQRLLMIYLLGRPDLYTELTGEVNGKCMEAAMLLKDVALHGVLVPNCPGNLKILFTTIDTTYGRKSCIEIGDSLELTLFSHAGTAATTITYEGTSVKLEPMAYVLYQLRESTFDRVINLLERTLPTKKRSHATSKANKKRGPTRKYASKDAVRMRCTRLAFGNSCSRKRACRRCRQCFAERRALRGC